MVKPAEAEAERVRILAEGRRRADADPGRGRGVAQPGGARPDAHRPAAADRKAGGQGLAGANVNVLNGADGLGEIATGLVSQGMTIFESLRGGMRQGEDTPSPPARSALEQPPATATPNAH